MSRRKLLLAALAVSSLGVMPLPASANTGVFIDVAPPPPRHEVMPPDRRGYVWQPGYWDWRAHRHVWVKGYWMKERPGMYWHPSRWEKRDGHWVLEKGRWDRERWNEHRGRGGPGGDRDRDRIPNRVDRDKDGDGVPNRLDSAPGNPRRQ